MIQRRKRNGRRSVWSGFHRRLRYVAHIQDKTIGSKTHPITIRLSLEPPNRTKFLFITAGMFSRSRHRPVSLTTRIRLSSVSSRDNEKSSVSHDRLNISTSKGSILFRSRSLFSSTYLCRCAADKIRDERER